MPIVDGKLVRGKRIVRGADPESLYRESVRKALGEACVYHEIPSLYRPGVENNPDLSTGIMLLALHEETQRLSKVINELSATPKRFPKEKNKKKAAVKKKKTNSKGLVIPNPEPDLGA